MALIKDKILVIEDEKSISYLLGTVLTANGYDVIKAYTGTEACEMLDAYCPDLILLDLGLPDMDGVDIIPPRSEPGHSAYCGGLRPDPGAGQDRGPRSGGR